MRKSTLTWVLGLGVLVAGCARESPHEVESAELRARTLIEELTNATPRTIVASEGVRTNILSITSRRTQMEVLEAWTRALMGLYDVRQGTYEHASVVSAVDRALDDGLLRCMDELGRSYEECWEIRFEQLRHVEDNIRRHDPQKTPRLKTITDESMKWLAYRGLVEHRERLIERHECRRMYRTRAISEDRYDAVRRRFEQMIGRPVRASEDIKSLGKYARMKGEAVWSQAQESMKGFREELGKNPAPPSPEGRRGL